LEEITLSQKEGKGKAEHDAHHDRRRKPLMIHLMDSGKRSTDIRDEMEVYDT
jgi:hypothetical protein